MKFFQIVCLVLIIPFLLFLIVYGISHTSSVSTELLNIRGELSIRNSWVDWFLIYVLPKNVLHPLLRNLLLRNVLDAKKMKMKMKRRRRKKREDIDVIVIFFLYFVDLLSSLPSHECHPCLLYCFSLYPTFFLPSPHYQLPFSPLWYSLHYFFSLFLHLPHNQKR